MPKYNNSHIQNDICVRSQTSEINSFSDEAALAAINAAICNTITSISSMCTLGRSKFNR